MNVLNIMTAFSIFFGATVSFAADDCSKDLSKTCAMIYTSASFGERSLNGTFVATAIRFAGSDVWYNITANDAFYTYSYAVINDNTGEVTLKSKTSSEVISLGKVNTDGLHMYGYTEVQMNPNLSASDDVQVGSGWTNCIPTALGLGRKEYTKSETHHLSISSSSVQNPAKFMGEKVLERKTSICLK